MLSAKNICVIRIAIEICNNNFELKREILCASGSDFSIKSKDCEEEYEFIEHWDGIVEKKAVTILENLEFPKQLQKEVLGVVLLIGMKMLTWAEYHEGTLGFSREYSLNFLNSSFFTQHGIIDNKKAAEELMKDESFLNIVQKYKLACLYCFMDHIPALFGQLTKENKAAFYDAQWPDRIKQPEIVTFWSYHLMGDIDKLKGEKSLDQYRLEKAIESGSKATVEYCLEKTNLQEESAFIDAAVEMVKNQIGRGPGPATVDDWVVFRYYRYNGSEESWIPSDYYVDILHFLLSKMRDDQKVEFLKKDIEIFPFSRLFETLVCFLNWPYQSYFMKTAELIWEFLPERCYADLLLEICYRIESEKWVNLKYGEEKIFDYRGLLTKFWHQAPNRCKRYVLSDRAITLETGEKSILGRGKELLVKLFRLKDFTYKDWQNIELILASVTDKEKENVISSEEGKYICFGLIEDERWEILNKFLSICFMSKEQADEFKKELMIYRGKVQCICIDFVKNDKWDAAESLMKWSGLPEEGINKLKEEAIYSRKGRFACVHLISSNKKMEAVNKFIRWCLPSEEKAKAFKKELAFSNEGISGCINLSKLGQLECMDEFVNFCLSSEEEIKELKKRLE